MTPRLRPSVMALLGPLYPVLLATPAAYILGKDVARRIYYSTVIQGAPGADVAAEVHHHRNVSDFPASSR